MTKNICGIDLYRPFRTLCFFIVTQAWGVTFERFLTQFLS
jgi:hypothetical protein